MAFSLNPSEQLARARGDLRMGVGIVLSDAQSTWLVFAVEALSPERLAATRALGEACIAVTARRAETLKARPYDGDLARIALPPDADLRWIRGLADPADDLSMPMKGPLHAVRDGDAGAHRVAIRLAKDARLLPAVLVTPLESGEAFAQHHGLTVLSIAQAAPLLARSAPYADVVHASLPMMVSNAGRVHVFRPDDGGEEHYAVEVGRVDRSKPVLVRLHSACFTGDVLGSLKCDCGPQLRGAMAQMGEVGAGVLLYLNQEGRGIGLANKMRAYSLQDQGFDTVEANHRLGFEDDERDFRIGAALLRKLRLTQIRLLTNNPAKIEMMERNGIEVLERVALKVGKNPFNETYLATKASKSRHML